MSSDDARPKLDGLQLEAVRLDFLGQSCRAIGEAVGRSRTTVWKWQQLPEYQAHYRQLQAEADRMTVGEAHKLRGDALKVVRASITRIGQRLAKDTVSNSELAALGRAALDVYKTTAAQTGISERRTIEHEGTVSVNAEADSLVDELIGAD
jgi:hypothetical protein